MTRLNEQELVDYIRTLGYSRRDVVLEFDMLFGGSGRHVFDDDDVELMIAALGS